MNDKYSIYSFQVRFMSFLFLSTSLYCLVLITRSEAFNCEMKEFTVKLGAPARSLIRSAFFQSCGRSTNQEAGMQITSASFFFVSLRPMLSCNCNTLKF